MYDHSQHKPWWWHLKTLQEMLLLSKIDQNDCRSVLSKNKMTLAETSCMKWNGRYTFCQGLYLFWEKKREKKHTLLWALLCHWRFLKKWWGEKIRLCLTELLLWKSAEFNWDGWHSADMSHAPCPSAVKVRRSSSLLSFREVLGL